ncbi:MAG TPA: pyridoxal phosphate-dependent aminotransferase [Gammaproteobacteria bacterium]|nr:pyridoxal phosphate-dependent aminotransferase [Gammaproteobacteria bacterium]
MSIRLAQRLLRVRPSPTVGITALAQRLREAGRDVVVLSVGEPDFATPEHVKAAARDALARNDTKYTAVDGTRQLKEAVVAKFKRDNGLDYTPEQVLISNGAKQSCYNACLALLDPGDEAIIPAPYWVSYPDMVLLADAEPVIVLSTAESGFRISAAQLAAAITPKTRLVILNSPCNPTGAVYSRADLRAFGAVLRAHPQIVVLTDDIYEHIYWGDEPFASFAQVCPDLYDRTITVNGMSKAYAMSGWRLGYAAGPPAVIKAMTSIQSQSTTNASTISQAAARAALVGDQACVRAMCSEFRQRHDFVLERLNRIAGFRSIAASGTFYLFPNIEGAMRIKRITTDVEFCEQLLEGAGVALVPGSAFGAPGHLRLSFAASVETLASALTRLERFMAA